jgi:hypothetical protein
MPDPSDPSRPGQHRFYDDLAVWWPLISPPADYADGRGGV